MGKAERRLRTVGDDLRRNPLEAQDGLAGRNPLGHYPASNLDRCGGDSAMDYPRGVRPMRGKLQIRWQVDNVPYSEVLELPQTRAGIADAVRIRKARLEQARYGLSSGSHPFEEVAQTYLDQLDGAPSTRSLYKGCLERYWGVLGGRDVAAITIPNLIAVDDGTSWPSAKTRSDALIPLRGTFKVAKSRGWIQANPAEALHSTKRKHSEPDPYSIKERDTLLTYLDETLAGFYFQVAFGTGARTGELIALEWDDYDGESLWINKGRVRAKLKDTKNSRNRKVLLLPELADYINSMPRPIRGGPMFATQHGKPYKSGNELNVWFREAHKETGVRQRLDVNGNPTKYPWRPGQESNLRTPHSTTFHTAETPAQWESCRVGRCGLWENWRKTGAELLPHRTGVTPDLTSQGLTANTE